MGVLAVFVGDVTDLSVLRDVCNGCGWDDGLSEYLSLTAASG